MTIGCPGHSASAPVRVKEQCTPANAGLGAKGKHALANTGLRNLGP